MTFELAHVHGIRCTLVDPRPLRLTKQQQRQLQAAGRAAAIHTLTGEQLQGLPQGLSPGVPRRAAVDVADASAGAGADSADASDSNAAAAAAGASPEGALALHQVQAWFGPELWRSASWRQRFARGFSLVLACHPDQATDPALDYALEAELPFAIVPCCVFPRLFPHRRLLQPSSGGGGTSSDTDTGQVCRAGGEGLCPVPRGMGWWWQPPVLYSAA